MVYKYEYANLLASYKVLEISRMNYSRLPEHYKTMTFEDWCKYYMKLPKKLLKRFLDDKKNKNIDLEEICIAQEQYDNQLL